MLKVGDRVPPLEAVNHDGTRVSLAAYQGRPVVLYFFPRAGTPGCTRETRGFVEGYEELQRRGIAVIGVSTDPVGRQHSFAQDCHAAFPILADPDRAIARAFGVLGLLGMARRVTFLVGADGTILEVVEGMRPGPHVEAALRPRPPKSAGGAP